MSVPNGAILRGTVTTQAVAASTLLNIFHWVLSTAAPLSEAFIMNLVTTWLTDDLIPAIAGNLDNNTIARLLNIDVVDNDGHVIAHVGQEGVTLPGTVGGENMPAGVAMYCQMGTNTPKVFGRKYIGGVAEGVIQDGYLTDAAVSRLATYTGVCLSRIADGAVHLDPGVISAKEGRFVEFNNTGFAFNVPAYQRRRKPGVGS